MSKAMQSIVDTYVALNRPEALHQLQAHRLKLIGSERSGSDLFRQQIEDELVIIRAGLVKLSTPLQSKPDEAKSESVAAQQVDAEPELPFAIVQPPPTSDPRLPVAVLSTSVKVTAQTVAEQPKPVTYGFPASGIAMPILAAAVFSKDTPDKDQAGHAIRMQLDLEKRRKT
jgi:hypothetical protein